MCTRASCRSRIFRGSDQETPGTFCASGLATRRLARRRWQFNDIVVEPPPAQRPHPPWVAAGSAASIRAAERGFNLILDQYASPAVIDERIALYRSVLAEHGKPFDPMSVAVARRLYVAKGSADRDAAMERQAE